MIIIPKQVGGKTEYITDENGAMMKFETPNRALVYLIKTAGYTAKDISNDCIRMVYTNERRECRCGYCEDNSNCYIKDKFQRLPPENTNGLGLGLCPKLKDGKE